MIVILEQLYKLWEVIVILGVVVGFAAGLATFIPVKFSGDDEEKHKMKTETIRRWSKTIFVLAIIVLCISGITAMAFTYVPDITHKTVQEAKFMLDERGLELDLPNGIPYNDETNQYTINKQYTKFDSFVAKGTPISVTLDYNGNSAYFVEVPNIVGESYLNAITMLDNRGLLYNTKVVSEVIESFDKAIVINQSITANSRVASGTTIYLEVSFVDDSSYSPENTSGTENTSEIENNDEMVKVPNVVDMEEQEAANMLEACGLEPIITWMPGVDENKDIYYIISQSIPAGSTVPKGTIIEIGRSSVKLGTPVVVPYVIGMEQIEAISLLTKSGLQFQVWWTAEENEIPSDVYYIKDQSIEAGDTVPAGTLVELELTSKNPNG